MSDAPQSDDRPRRGLVRDMHQAKVGAKATAEELRAYVREFRGRSPQEMLGLVAASSLVQGTLLATIITVIFMGAFTVGPYFLKKANPPVAKTVKPPEPAKAATPAAPAASGAAAAASPAPATAASSAPAASRPNTPVDPLAPAGASPDAIKALGIGESKTADPKKNPLDAGADDLLKDLK